NAMPSRMTGFSAGVVLTDCRIAGPSSGTLTGVSGATVCCNSISRKVRVFMAKLRPIVWRLDDRRKYPIQPGTVFQRTPGAFFLAVSEEADNVSVIMKNTLKLSVVLVPVLVSMVLVAQAPL